MLLIAGCGAGGGYGSGGGGGSGGGASSPVPIYILVGGASAPSGAYVYLDNGVGRLDSGEVFIMARNALLANSQYRVDYSIVAGGTTFTGTWSFTTGSGNETAQTATVLAEINRYRADAGEPAIVANSALDLSATRHAGYQAETDAISHNESDTTKVFYVNTDFYRRISIANGGTASSNSWPGTSTDTVYETIATKGDAGAAVSLWNTVYHRIPMMRRHTTLLGNGDRSDAMADSRYTGAVVPPFVGPGTANQQYETIDYSANSALAQIASHWPPDGATGIGLSFDSDTESPDPLSTVNGNGTPSDGVVGTPLHLVLPTTASFASLTISLTKL